MKVGKKQFVDLSSVALEQRPPKNQKQNQKHTAIQQKTTKNTFGQQKNHFQAKSSAKMSKNNSWRKRRTNPRWVATLGLQTCPHSQNNPNSRFARKLLWPGIEMPTIFLWHGSFIEW